MIKRFILVCKTNLDMLPTNWWAFNVHLALSQMKCLFFYCINNRTIVIRGLDILPRLQGFITFAFSFVDVYLSFIFVVFVELIRFFFFCWIQIGCRRVYGSGDLFATAKYGLQLDNPDDTEVHQQSAFLLAERVIVVFAATRCVTLSRLFDVDRQVLLFPRRSLWWARFYAGISWYVFVPRQKQRVNFVLSSLAFVTFRSLFHLHSALCLYCQQL